MVDIYRSTCLTSSMAPLTDPTFPRTAIDLFCGCGGISEGLRMAGFEVLAGIDVEPKYIATFKHNFPDAVAVTKNLDEIDPLEFLAAINLDAGNIGILAGGLHAKVFQKMCHAKIANWLILATNSSKHFCVSRKLFDHRL